MNDKKVFLLVCLGLAFSARALAQTDAPPVPPCTCPCPCPEPPPPPLTGSLAAGLSITTGNSDTSAFNLAFGLVYDPKTHSLFKADALYLRSWANGDTTSDKATAALRYEYKVSDRIYAFGQVAYLRDTFKNVTYLITPMVGGGYYVVKQQPSSCPSTDPSARRSKRTAATTRRRAAPSRWARRSSGSFRRPRPSPRRRPASGR